jgi:hypothetical protein
MTQPASVPEDRRPLTKGELHAKLMVGWSRAIAAVGSKAAFAERMDITTEGLRQQINGSFPGFDMIDRAFDLDGSVLDDWLTTKGKRIVDDNAICDTDDASVLIARLMLWLQEAQHPESPGGRRIVHTELVGAEQLIRQLHGATGNWLARITDLRSAA